MARKEKRSLLIWWFGIPIGVRPFGENPRAKTTWAFGPIVDNITPTWEIHGKFHIIKVWGRYKWFQSEVGSCCRGRRSSPNRWIVTAGQSLRAWTSLRVCGRSLFGKFFVKYLRGISNRE